MNDNDLIGHIRRSLDLADSRIPPAISARLAHIRGQALRRAEASADASHPLRPALLWVERLWFSFSARPAWAYAAGAVAVTAIALGVVREVSIDRDLEKIARIDQGVITAALPVQAYLDPGFAVFQEEKLPASGVAFAGASKIPARDFWSLDSLFPGASLSSGPAWGKLSSAQREALAPLETSWEDMGALRKRKWLKIAERFSQMSAQERMLAQDRMLEWVSLPVAQRREARGVFTESVEKIPQDVQVMKWNEYLNLPKQERERLTEVARQRAASAR